MNHKRNKTSEHSWQPEEKGVITSSSPFFLIKHFYAKRPGLKTKM